MKKSTLSIALATALLSMSVAQASEFKGGYIGANIGSDRSSATKAAADLPSAATKGYGLVGGYNADVMGVVLGLDGFYDADSATTHAALASKFGSKVYGLDAKLGRAYGNWLPFVKVGYGHTAASVDLSTAAGNGLHSGFGVEYKFAPHWSVEGEYTLAKANTKPGSIANKKLGLGVNYYFDSPYVAPAIVAAVAPIVMKKAEPVVVAAPVPAPVVVAPAPVVVAKPVVVAPAPAPKTIFTDKPITIEGASFATGSAKLKPAASKQLDVVVEFAAKNKDANLTVEGYTDNRGKEKANQALSAQRAEAVKAYLVKKGVDAKRIATEGKGSAKAIGDNKTEAGRAQNRRVEIDSVVRVAK